MNCNLIIICASLILIIAMLIYSYYKWQRYSIIDLYFAFIGIHFGISPLIKALLQDYSTYNPSAIILTFLQIYLIMGIIAVITAYLPESLGNILEIRYLIQQWARIGVFSLWVLLTIILLIQVIGYWKYNVIANVDHGELAIIGKKLPYWYSSSLMLLNDFIFCCFIGFSVKLLEAKGLARKLLVIPLLLVIAAGAIYGRRVIFNMMLVGIILWFITTERNIFKLRYLTIFIAMTGALFIFSNIYQSYRSALQFLPQTKFSELKNPFSAALDGRTTLKNIHDRPAPWEFNYMVFFGQLNGQDRDVPYGVLFHQGIKNSIPGLFWKNKTVESLNDMIAKRFDLPVIDYAKNNFGFAQADFGYFSIVLIPLAIIIILMTMALIVKLTQSQPLLLWLLSGIIINYLINIEQSAQDIIILFRNISLFTGIYVAGYYLWNNRFRAG